MKKLNNNGFTMVEVMIAAVLGCLLLVLVANLGVEYAKKRRHDNIHRIFRNDIERAFEYIADGYYDTNANIRRVGVRYAEWVTLAYDGSRGFAPNYAIDTALPLFPIPGASDAYGNTKNTNFCMQNRSATITFGAFYVGKTPTGEKALVYGFNDTNPTIPTAAWTWREIIPSTPEKRFFDDIRLLVCTPPGIGLGTGVNNIQVKIVLIRYNNPRVVAEGVKTFATNMGAGSVP
ncbi:MAG: prepilin-type N-terminal cleavage/methylation domain-containing protein [Pseudomonadota bacterium]